MTREVELLARSLASVAHGEDLWHKFREPIRDAYRKQADAVLTEMERIEAEEGE